MFASIVFAFLSFICTYGAVVTLRETGVSALRAQRGETETMTAPVAIMVLLICMFGSGLFFVAALNV